MESDSRQHADPARRRCRAGVPGASDGAVTGGREPGGPATGRPPAQEFRLGRRRLLFFQEGAGPTLLLLHGAAAERDEEEWDHQWPVLAPAGYRVVFPLRAGRGGSDPDGPVTIAKDGGDAWALLDHLGLKRAVLIGHSAGAAVARQMYLTRPEGVEAIVSVDSGAFGKFDFQGGAFGPERFDEAARVLHARHREALAAMGREWDYPSEFNVNHLARLMRWRRANPARREAARGLPDAADAPVPEGRWCRVPLLVFAAGRGRVRPGDPEAADLAVRLPGRNARLEVITDSGHYIQQERPEAFNARLLDFLAALG